MSEVKAMEEGVKVESSATTVSPRFTNRTKLLALVVAVAVVVGAAMGISLNNSKNNGTTTMTQPSGSDNPVAPPTNTESTVGLNTATRLAAISPETIVQSYGSCDEMTADLTIAARMVGERAIKGALGYYFPPYEETFMFGGPAFGYGAIGGSAPLSSSVDTSTKGETSFGTNNQINGVNEADIVQSNGVQVFTAYGPEILELDARTSTITSRTRIPDETKGCDSSAESIMDMLLLDDRLVVIASTYCYNYTAYADAFLPNTTSDSPIMYSLDVTRALVYEATTMTLISTVPIPGSYVTSRAVGSNIHIVSTPFITWDYLTKHVDPYFIDMQSEANLTVAEYTATAKVELERHLPDFVAKLLEEIDCTGMQKMALFQNGDADLDFAALLNSMVTISSFAATSPSVTSSKSMMVPSNSFQVFSSNEYLVLAIQGWWIESGATEETYLVAYGYNGAAVTPAAFGRVPGYVMSQLSMDQASQDGVDYLRIATTTQFQMELGTNGSWDVVQDSSAMVAVLELSGAGSQMPMAGLLTSLGTPGEQITAVQFLGDRGYVVTMDLTNPMYTLDLSDPTNPKVVGEIAVPGFTNYIQAIDSDFVVGVGMGADDLGSTTGFEISVYNVSDLSNPIRVQNLDVAKKGNATFDMYTEAQFNSKAWRYLNESKLLIIPVTYSEYSLSPCSVSDDLTDLTAAPNAECFEISGGYDGFRIFKVDLVTGITPSMTIKHVSGDDFVQGCWNAFALPPRSLVFDGDIMTLKGHSILSHDLTTMTKDATDIILDTDVEKCNAWSI